MAGIVSAIYHSGPGWIHDIFEVEILFDADLEDYCSMPWLRKAKLADGSTEVIAENFKPLFASGAPVRGIVRVTAPPGRTVWHDGVFVRLESGFYALEEIATRDLYSEEVSVASGAYVTGVAEYPFAFSAAGSAALLESYEGSLFSIRHKVSATVIRPWYTFEVSADGHFNAQKIYDIPSRASYQIDSSQDGSTKQGEGAAGAGAGAAGSGAVLAGVHVSGAEEEGKAGGAASSSSVDALSEGMQELRVIEGGVGLSHGIKKTTLTQDKINAQLGLYSQQTMVIPVVGEEEGEGEQQGADTAAGAAGTGVAATAAAEGAAAEGEDASSSSSSSSILVTYDKGCYELSEHLQGSIVFKNIRKPIILVRLAVVKIEYADGEVHDTVVFDETILDSRKWRQFKLAQLGLREEDLQPFLEDAAMEKTDARLRRKAKLRKIAAARAKAEKAAAGGAAEGEEEEEEEEEEEVETGDSDADSTGAAAAAAMEGGAAGSAGAGKDPQEQLLCDLARWKPSLEDLDGDEEGNLDPDLPVVGDVTLALDLDFTQLNVTPTLVVKVPKGESSSGSAAAGAAGAAAGEKKAAKEGQAATEEEEEISVRYFLRITVYTDVTALARSWNAAEIILFRDRLYGRLVGSEDAAAAAGTAEEGEDEDEEEEAEGEEEGEEVELGEEEEEEEGGAAEDEEQLQDAGTAEEKQQAPATLEMTKLPSSASSSSSASAAAAGAGAVSARSAGDKRSLLSSRGISIAASLPPATAAALFAEQGAASPKTGGEEVAGEGSLA